MKNIFILSIMFMFFVSFGLPSYAASEIIETRHETFTLDSNYSNEFFIRDSKLESYKVSQSFSDNDQNTHHNYSWLWSFLFPGLGQLVMGELVSGVIFSGLALTIVYLTFYLLIPPKSGGMTGDMSALFIIPIGLLLYLINYTASIINAFIASKNN